ncbi:MAG: hypothetical protein AAB599_04015 [Patescibacteria group bacterium]
MKSSLLTGDAKRLYHAYYVIELPHAVVGAAIAAKVGNPALSLPLALASHFVLDMVPHWNPHLNREVAKYGHITRTTKYVIGLDVAASLCAGFFIASTALPDSNRSLLTIPMEALLIILGAFLGVLPDVLEAPYFFWRSKSTFLKKLVAFQSSMQFNVPIIPGLISQLLVIAAAFWWVFGNK